MKKLIYSLVLLFGMLMVNGVSAQKQWCGYTDYNLDTIAYSPALPFNVGIQIPFHIDTLSPSPISHYITDSFSTVIQIGFNFNFYGADYNSLVISKQGYVCFDTTLGLKTAPNCYNLVSKSIDLFSTHILLYKPSPGSIKYSIYGTAPNRRFIVSYDSITAVPQWFGGPLLAPLNYLTGQIVLYETSSNIEMHILNVNGNGNDCPYIVQGIVAYVSNNTKATFTSDETSFSREQYHAFRFTQYNLPQQAVSPICMVSVDSTTGKNMIVWDKPSGLSIDSFIVYKESNVAGVYNVLNVQPYNAYSSYIDSSSVPEQQANRYKLAFRDSCGLISAPNSAHKTIHLTISQGIGNTWNLNWDAYEGISYGSVHLYRGTTSSSLTLLTTLASNLYSYTDLTPPVGSVYYVIGVDVTGGCNPTAIRSVVSSILSNIVSNHATGLPSWIDKSSISIFPNPASQTVNIKLKINGKTDLTIVINDVTGRIVYSKLYKNASSSFKEAIDCSAFSKGIYIAEIKTEGGNYNRKVVVE